MTPSKVDMDEGKCDGEVKMERREARSRRMKYSYSIEKEGKGMPQDAPRELPDRVIQHRQSAAQHLHWSRSDYSLRTICMDTKLDSTLNQSTAAPVGRPACLVRADYRPTLTASTSGHAAANAVSSGPLLRWSFASVGQMSWFSYKFSSPLIHIIVAFVRESEFASDSESSDPCSE